MSKNADEFMKESNKLLETKKATSEQHKVTLSVDYWCLSCQAIGGGTQKMFYIFDPSQSPIQHTT